MLINGKHKDIEPGTTVAELIEAIRLPKNIVRVKVNGKKISEEDYEMELDEDSNVEIYSFIGGG
ncbi:sulfur carrier protein ThiS [Clostridium sp. Cult1]|uniref:sulfur carrier protein ThiS n=1 Tax=Clostridium sp. Cult1 TaxID=2079002 RepID=UPI001F01FD21